MIIHAASDIELQINDGIDHTGIFLRIGHMEGMTELTIAGARDLGVKLMALAAVAELRDQDRRCSLPVILCAGRLRRRPIAPLYDRTALSGTPPWG